MRVVGTLLASFSTALLGMLLALHREKTLKYIDALIYLVEHIKYSSKFFKSELSQIYREFENPFLEKIGFLDCLRKEGLLFALEKYSSIYKLRFSEQNCLLNLAASLGKAALQNELEQCDTVCESLMKYRQERAEKCPEEKKLFVSMGIIIGLLIAVVLL